MLILTSPPFARGRVSEAFLARIVIPRSRSCSPESMTRSTTCSWAAKVPAWRSIASTRVVFPWSTCEMIAMFRSSARADTLCVAGRAWRPRRVATPRPPAGQVVRPEFVLPALATGVARFNRF